MSSKGQPRDGGRPSIGSIIIVSILRIVGGLSELFHFKGKWSCGNMTDKEKETFSTMMDGMKQELTKKDR